MASTWGNDWWKYAAIIVLAIFGLMVTLYYVSERPIIPLPRELDKIRALPYDAQTMNCQHKAGLYAAALKAAGYTRWIAIGTVDGKGHAWVIFLDDGGKRRLIDPTGPTGGPSGYLEASYDRYRATFYTDEQWGAS
jgi:transglutaminase-like putative cysteine protease